jgi:hypothetical protein
MMPEEKKVIQGSRLIDPRLFQLHEVASDLSAGLLAAIERAAALTACAQLAITTFDTACLTLRGIANEANRVLLFELRLAALTNAIQACVANGGHIPSQIFVPNGNRVGGNIPNAPFANLLAFEAAGGLYVIPTYSCVLFAALFFAAEIEYLLSHPPQAPDTMQSKYNEKAQALHTAITTCQSHGGDVPPNFKVSLNPMTTLHSEADLTSLARTYLGLP